MIDLSNHPYFEAYTDEESGVTSYVLTKRVAPIQQSFYFSNQSLTANQKYLWFYCAFPPARGHALGVLSLDADDPFIKYFPNSFFDDVSPVIAPDDSGVYYTVRDEVYFIDYDGNTKLIAKLPADFVRGRHVFQISTALTISADRKKLLLDGQIGTSWFVATVDIASGEVQLLHKFARKYNHAQFSPTDPDLFIIDQDWWCDIVSGEVFQFDQRIWLMNQRQTIFRPLVPENWYMHGSENCHDFFSKDGNVCWVDYKLGAFEYIIDTGKVNHVWKTPLCHSQASRNRDYWVADQSPYFWWSNGTCAVKFFNRANNKEINIFSALASPSKNYETTTCRSYHCDPHPTFSQDDKYIISTTTVYGRVDVAITPVDVLIEKTKQ